MTWFLPIFKLNNKGIIQRVILFNSFLFNLIIHYNTFKFVKYLTAVLRRNYSQMTVPGSQAVVKAAVTRCCQESTSSGLAPSTTSNILFKEPKNYKSRRFFSNKEMFLYHIFYLIFISLILINPNRFSQTFLFITYTLLFPFTYYKQLQFRLKPFKLRLHYILN